MKLNPGVGYTSANLGEASGLTIDAGVESSARNIGRQFECSITGAKVGESYEYRLHVRKGLVEFDYYGSDDKGIIDIENLGGISGTNTQNMFIYMNKFNLFPTGSLTEGTEENSEFFSKNGYIKLTTGKNYFVFLYKTTPDWKQESNDLYEAKSPQIGIAAEDSEPNIFIKTQRNGGGFLQSYLQTTPKTLQIPIVNEEGVIGTFDNAEVSCELEDIGGFSPHAAFGDYLINVNALGTEAKEVAGQLEDKGTGFVTTDCYRQDIAYIKWNAGINRFQIYQIQYGVIHFRQNPLGSFKTKLLTDPTQIAKWGTGFDLCNLITGTFSGYTKDLNQSKLADQTPAYAGTVDIGNYQSPKETL